MQSDSISKAEENIIDGINWASEAMIIFASGLLLFGFIGLREKTFGHYMILILICSSLTFPLMNFLTDVFASDEHKEEVSLVFGVAIYRFSLYWSAAIAIFTYLIIAKKKDVNPKRFMIIGLICCLIFTLLCPLM